MALFVNLFMKVIIICQIKLKESDKISKQIFLYSFVYIFNWMRLVDTYEYMINNMFIYISINI